MNHTRTKKGRWDKVFARLKKDERPERGPPDPNGHTYGYFRVSTSRQAEDGYSLEGQKAAIAKYAAEKGFGKVEFFVDPGASASKIPLANREAGRLLVERIRTGDRVIIPKIDRAFRSFGDFVAWHEAWTKMGVDLHVVNFHGAGADCNSTMGRLLMRTLGSFAALESEFNSERVLEAFATKRGKGYLINSKAPRGFMAKNVGTRLKPLYIAVPDPAQRKLMGQVLAWYEDGWSQCDIARHLTAHDVPFTGKWQKNWNQPRVWKMIQAERKLRAIELEQGENP